MGLTDIIDFKKQHNTDPQTCSIEILQLHAWSLMSVCVVWASAWVTVQCIKTAKRCNFPEGRAKTVGDGKFYIEPPNCRSASWKTCLS